MVAVSVRRSKMISHINIEELFVSIGLPRDGSTCFLASLNKGGSRLWLVSPAFNHRSQHDTNPQSRLSFHLLRVSSIPCVNGWQYAEKCTNCELDLCRSRSCSRKSASSHAGLYASPPSRTSQSGSKHRVVLTEWKERWFEACSTVVAAAIRWPLIAVARRSRYSWVDRT